MYRFIQECQVRRNTQVRRPPQTQISSMQHRLRRNLNRQIAPPPPPPPPLPPPQSPPPPPPNSLLHPPISPLQRVIRLPPVPTHLPSPPDPPLSPPSPLPSPPLPPPSPSSPTQQSSLSTFVNEPIYTFRLDETNYYVYESMFQQVEQEIMRQSIMYSNARHVQYGTFKEKIKNDMCPILQTSFEDTSIVCYFAPCFHAIDSSTFEDFVTHFHKCPLCNASLTELHEE